MLDRWFRKEKPMFTMLGMGGGNANRALAGGLGPFQATGGTKSGPTGGYFYHEFTSNDTFEVTDGIADIEVMLQGAGGQGGGGAGYNGGDGGGGGGGGATGVWTITGVTIGTHYVTVAAGRDHPGGVNDGDPGQSTTLTLPGSGNVNSGGGGGGGAGNGPGNGGSGGSNSDPWAAATLTGDYPGGNGNNHSGSQGGNGGIAGGQPQPSDLWWRPYINPGSGGSGGPPGGGAGNKGSNRGGGGGGGGAGVPAGHKGGSTAGICVIRYPDAV